MIHFLLYVSEWSQSDSVLTDLLTAQRRPFFNYVDKLLPIIDHLPPPSWNWWRNPFTVIRENLHTVDQRENRLKRVLRNIYYSPQSKDSISLEVAVETKLFPDSALGNSLCNSGYKTKSEKNLFFPGLTSPLKIRLPPQGWSHGVPSLPRNLEKVQNYPQLVKWATLFRANPVIILLHVSSLTLNNLHYILSALSKAAISVQVKEKIKILVW